MPSSEKSCSWTVKRKSVRMSILALLKCLTFQILRLHQQLFSLAYLCSFMIQGCKTSSIEIWGINSEATNL